MNDERVDESVGERPSALSRTGATLVSGADSPAAVRLDRESSVSTYGEGASTFGSPNPTASTFDAEPAAAPPLPANIALAGLSPRHRQMAENLGRTRARLALGNRAGGGGGGASDASDRIDGMLPWICFAPDTPAEVMEAITGSGHGHLAARALGATAPGSGFSAAAFQFLPTARWTRTALSGSFLEMGESTILTWSIVDDGLSIPGNGGEPTSPSDLRARLNQIYPGGEAEWLPLFEQVFADWSEVSGLKYVYQPNDSGTFPTRSGSNSRGDIRIAGHFIDGNNNTLAYNFGPNNGDMVIDTGDSFFDSTSGNSIRLRNVIAHEHGHGIGLAHVCPINRTKLMEPNVTTQFDGPQLDDIYSAQRQYGDRLEDTDLDSREENNDAVSRAADLGSLGVGTHLFEYLSIDDNSDEDFLRFSPVGAGLLATVTLRPVGANYLEGGQNSDGSCSSGIAFNSLVVHDLSLRIEDDAGAVLASANANPAGSPETLTNLLLPAGDIVVFIDGDATDACQLYELEITLAEPPPPPTLVLNGGDVEETAGTVSYSIGLTEPARFAATVDVSVLASTSSPLTATPGADFVTATVTTLTYDPGQSFASGSVTIIDDALAEADESFVLSFSNPVNLQLPASPEVAVTIIDDDAPAQLAGSGSISLSSSDSIEIDFLSVPGRTYAVETSIDLVVWSPLAGFENFVPTTTGPIAIPFPEDLGRRFYRVVEP